MSHTLKEKATNSVLWSAVERFSVQGTQYLITIIIARLVMPEDYGLIAMLGIFLAISQTFIDGGFGNALIQKGNNTERDFSTVFYFNTAVSILLYGLLYLSSPYIAAFYNEDKLDLITKVIGIILIINSLGIVQQARLTIELDFKRMAIASLTAVIISGAVGIYLAYEGYGAWALVWNTLLNNILRVAIIWVLSKWIPKRIFSLESFKTLFSFGSKILLSSILHTIYTNLYTLIIGKKFSAADLGFFNRASTLAHFPSTNLTNIIVRAVYPIQCSIKDNSEELNRTFLIYLRISCYVIFPIMVVMCALAEPLIEVVLTDKWLPAAPFFKILCIAYMWDPMMKINHNILNVKGRSDYFLKAELYKKAVAIVILFATIPFGIEVMCAGLILYSFADIIIIVRYTKKVIGITLMDEIKAVFPIIALSASMGLIAYLTTMITDIPILKLSLGLIVAGIYYLAASHIFSFKEYKDIVSLIKTRLK